MADGILTAQRARELLDYSPETGEFTWVRPLSNVVKPGSRAGTLLSNGYIYIHVDGVGVLGHRLAWLMHYGERAPAWPRCQIDHINRNKADNRISNLRLVTPSGNKQNRVEPHKNSRVGLLGVKRNGKDGFMSRITVNGREIYIGTFKTAIEAHQAYLVVKAKLHACAPYKRKPTNQT